MAERREQPMRYQRARNEASPGQEPPGGAAAFDPHNQSRRQDVPPEEQTAKGQPTRGNLPRKVRGPERKEE
jgi:hypothetical protein